METKLEKAKRELLESEAQFHDNYWANWILNPDSNIEPAYRINPRHRKVKINRFQSWWKKVKIWVSKVWPQKN